MISSDDKPRATKAWCDEQNLWVELADGRKVGVPLAYFPRLLAATPQQRGQVLMSGGGSGLHWDDLDEDISVQSLLAGAPVRKASA
jgi:hypothetical protein